MSKNKKGNFDAGKTTKTGEMIPSLFNWVTPDIQARIADRLAKTTNNEISNEFIEEPSNPDEHK